MAGKVADDDDALFPPPPKKVLQAGPAWRPAPASAHLTRLLGPQVALTSAPQFLVGVQLGKGGFGQVFKGSRAYPRASNPYKPTHVSAGPARDGQSARVQPWARGPPSCASGLQGCPALLRRWPSSLSTRAARA